MTRRFISTPPRSGSGSKKGGMHGATPTGRSGGAYGKSVSKNENDPSANHGKIAQQMALYKKGGDYGKKDERSNSNSAATMAARMMAQKMATRTISKKKGAIDMKNLKGMRLGGMYPGHIDKKGRIYGAGNQLILKIDMKSGDIKTAGFFGRKIGKFNPSSQSCMNMIYRELEKHALKYYATTGRSMTAYPNVTEEPHE